MKTALRKGRLSARMYGLKAVAGEPGVHEAIVSVFGNVDLQGDRIIPGAFADTLAAWKASGDNIPVIFSHQWDTLEAHIGAVVDAKELLPGDSMLPPELAGNGGLWTKMKLDLGAPSSFADRVDQLLSARRLKEFSFAYDVIDERRATDGANELVALDLIETGPTLKGANPATRLLADAPPDGPAPAAKTRVEVNFDGAVEAELEAMYLAGVTWARGLDVGNGGFYALHAAATYPAELRSVVLVEGWDDPVDDGVFYELSFERDDAGDLAVAEAAEVEVNVTLARKARALKHRGRGSNLDAKARATVVTEDEAEDPKGKARGTSPATPSDDIRRELIALELDELAG